MRRREFISLLGGAAAWPLPARAQQGERVRRIGLLSFYAENDAEGPRYIAKFLEALEQLGWAHGRDVQIDYRWAGADRDRFQRYAIELVELKPDLIVGQSTPAVAALLRATRAIPIVFVNVSDPIGSGFIESLSQPGSNITGFSNFEPAMGGKWVGFLKQIAPYVTRIALMSNPATPRKRKAIYPRLRPLPGHSEYSQSPPQFTTRLKLSAPSPRSGATRAAGSSCCLMASRSPIAN
jgi:putative tryptophan/tyrosine transport system substrate-binding protein